jgi:hypothetical protein
MSGESFVGYCSRASVFGDGRIHRDIAQARGLYVRELAVDDDADDRARHAVLRDGGFKCLIDGRGNGGEQQRGDDHFQ